MRLKLRENRNKEFISNSREEVMVEMAFMSGDLCMCLINSSIAKYEKKKVD